MPLTELSPNVRRHGSRRQRSPPLSRDGQPSSTALSMAPDPVQSMLKTTTETGDIGPFSVRPSRVPRSTSRLALARPRSGSFDSSFASHLRQRRTPTFQGSVRRHGPRQMRSFTGLARPDTVQSNLTCYHQTPRSRTRGPRPYGVEGLASSRLGPRSLYSHRSLMTLRSQRDYRSMHSNSPMSHAAQLRRVGHRATSPAFSDAFVQPRSFRPPYSRAGSFGTVTSSPSSIYPTRRGFMGHVSDMNNSFTSFARLPSPALPLSYGGTARSQRPSRTSTPGSIRDPRSASNVSIGSMRGCPKSPTSSTGPQYYDYSESFIEEDCFSPEANHSVSSLPFNIDQTILEHGPPPTHRRAQTPFGTLPGSSFRPAELPTFHNRTASELSKQSIPGVIPNRTSSLAASTTSKQQLASNDRLATAGGTNPTDDNLQPVDLKNSYSEDRDLCRASVTSRQTRTSSPSSSFFPNASRSPRDLSSLAARVHSPTPDQSQRGSRSQKARPHSVGKNPMVDQSDNSDHTTKFALPTWQLPSLNFRPFSLSSAGQVSTDRPWTSAGIPSRIVSRIISPNPERPVSSQSRKRFSKILEIGDAYQYTDEKLITVKTSFRFLNFSTLKKVDEIPESNYPARYSIPPFSPHKLIDIYNGNGDDLGGPATSPGANSNQTTSMERSTIESLLDRHIESLGLMPERSDEEAVESSQNCVQNSLSRTIEETVRLSDVTSAKGRKRRSQSDAALLDFTSSFGSPWRQRQKPTSLFENMNPNNSKSPMFHDTASTVNSADRPSYGWQSLASASQPPSTPFMNRLLRADGEGDEELRGKEQKLFKLQRYWGLSPSLTSSSGWSQETGDLYNSQNSAQPHRNPQEEVDRHASRRRRRRMKLKLKRNSQSLASIASKQFAEGPCNLDASQASSSGQVQGDEQYPAPNGPAELDSRNVSAPNSPRDVGAEKTHETAASPKIPNRGSSLIAVAPQIKRSSEMARKPSSRTMRSHPSVSSLAEPINSTRFASRAPQMVSQTSMLPPPDFGPALRVSTLDLTIPYAEVPSTIRPTLCGTQSFFSEDSSCLPNRPNTIRKNFLVNSLRNARPSSPKVEGHRFLWSNSEKNHVKIDYACQVAGHNSFEEHAGLDGTVGMSDFAYRKRKMMQRVKDWWMRQCVQKRLALKRKK